MKLPFSDKLERARVTIATARTDSERLYASARGDDYGLFYLRRTGNDPLLKVLCSPGSEEIPWEHVSVSTEKRCPTWDEMAWVKALFFDDEETVLQFHPPRSQYVNQHRFCLHLWKPHASVVPSVPLPPTIAVGLMSEAADLAAEGTR